MVLKTLSEEVLKPANIVVALSRDVISCKQGFENDLELCACCADVFVRIG